MCRAGKRVDGIKFLVDVEDYGTRTVKVYLPIHIILRHGLTCLALKRRPSMLRSLPSEMPLSSDTEDGDADQSMDGSSTCKQAHFTHCYETLNRCIQL